MNERETILRRWSELAPGECEVNGGWTRIDRRDRAGTTIRAGRSPSFLLSTPQKRGIPLTSTT